MDKHPVPKIIQGIIDACKIHFEDSTFCLKSETMSLFVISGDIMSKGINNFREGRKQVNVLKWFEEFWIYMETSFVLIDKAFPRIFVSISVFQGKSEDEHKTQLFRAEWDSYENNKHHAQPHWHLYPHKYHYRVYEDFEAFNDMKNEGFETLIKDDFKKIIDIRRIHFAMNAEWAKNLGAIHPLADIDILKNWLQGLFSDIKFQIRHAMRE